MSRQVARLDELGLVARRAGARDKRVREAEVTKAGSEVVAVIDETREKQVGELMADWTAAEWRELARMMKRLAADMNAWVLRQESRRGRRHRVVRHAVADARRDEHSTSAQRRQHRRLADSSANTRRHTSPRADARVDRARVVAHRSIPLAIPRTLSHNRDEFKNSE